MLNSKRAELTPAMRGYFTWTWIFFLSGRSDQRSFKLESGATPGLLLSPFSNCLVGLGSYWASGTLGLVLEKKWSFFHRPPSCFSVDLRGPPSLYPSPGSSPYLTLTCKHKPGQLLRPAIIQPSCLPLGLCSCFLSSVTQRALHSCKCHLFF